MPYKNPEDRHNYYLKNKQKMNEYSKQRHKEKLEERKAQQKEYREKTKGKRSEYNKRYWNEKKEILNPQNKARNKKKKYRYRDYQRQWERKNQQRRYEIELNLYRKYGQFLNLNAHEYKSVLIAWSKLVRNRDNNSCLQCGKPSNVSHHIIFKKTMPELSLNLNNGIALCIPCHKEIHRLNGY